MLSEIKRQEFRIGDILAVAWDIFQDNFGTIILITLLVFIPYFIVSKAMPTFEEESDFFDPRLLLNFLLFGALLIIISLIGIIAIANVVESAVQRKTIDFNEAFARAFARWIPAILTGSLAYLIIFGLGLLLIIPGIIAAIYLTFYLYAVALRNKAGVTALEYSKSLVEGRWFKVFGIIIGIGVLQFAANLIVGFPFAFAPDNILTKLASGAIDAIIYSFFTVAKVVFFFNLDYLKYPETPPETPTKQIW